MTLFSAAAAFGKEGGLFSDADGAAGRATFPAKMALGPYHPPCAIAGLRESPARRILC